MAKLTYVDNMDTDLGDTREVIGVVYKAEWEAEIYRHLGAEAIGVVVEDDDDE